MCHCLQVKAGSVQSVEQDTLVSAEHDALFLLLIQTVKQFVFIFKKFKVILGISCDFLLKEMAAFLLRSHNV